MENLSRVFQKQKRKKHMIRLSFIRQFKIEFILMFTRCREVLGKMHESITNLQTETKPKKTAQISLLLVVVERD